MKFTSATCIDCKQKRIVRVRSNGYIPERCKPCHCRNMNFDNYPVDGSFPSRSPLYLVWYNMVARCYNSRHEAFQYYGKRGITVCAEWKESVRDFIAWAESNGYRDGLQIDRRDNDGNYEPGNCRFTTPAKNSRNRRSAKLNEDKVAIIKTLLSLGDTLDTVAKFYGVSFQTIGNIRTGKTWREIEPYPSFEEAA